MYLSRFPLKDIELLQTKKNLSIKVYVCQLKEFITEAGFYNQCLTYKA